MNAYTSHAQLYLSSDVLFQVGAMVAYILDAARYREGALGSIWLTMGLVNMSLWFSEAVFFSTRPLVMSIMIAIGAGITLFTTGDDPLTIDCMLPQSAAVMNSIATCLERRMVIRSQCGRLHPLHDGQDEDSCMTSLLKNEQSLLTRECFHCKGTSPRHNTGQRDDDSWAVRYDYISATAPEDPKICICRDMGNIAVQVDPTAVSCCSASVWKASSGNRIHCLSHDAVMGTDSGCWSCLCFLLPAGSALHSLPYISPAAQNILPCQEQQRDSYG